MVNTITVNSCQFTPQEYLDASMYPCSSNQHTLTLDLGMRQQHVSMCWNKANAWLYSMALRYEIKNPLKIGYMIKVADNFRVPLGVVLFVDELGDNFIPVNLKMMV